MTDSKEVIHKESGLSVQDLVSAGNVIEILLKEANSPDAELVVNLEKIVIAINGLNERVENTIKKVEEVKNDIFYYMTRNHDRGEKSYQKLGEVKERLIKILNDLEGHRS